MSTSAHNNLRVLQVPAQAAVLDLWPLNQLVSKAAVEQVLPGGKQQPKVLSLQGRAHQTTQKLTVQF